MGAMLLRLRSMLSMSMIQRTTMMMQQATMMMMTMMEGGGDHYSPELRRSRRIRFQPDRFAEVDFDEMMKLARRDGDSGGREGACYEAAEEDEAPLSSGGEDVDVFYDVPDDDDEGLASLLSGEVPEASDPQVEHEAVNEPDRHRWMEAERDEHQSAMDGQVADLVPPPDNEPEPVLSSKRVYKTKRDEMTATSCATRQGSALSCGPSWKPEGTDRHVCSDVALRDAHGDDHDGSGHGSDDSSD